MSQEQNFTLEFLRADGRREPARLTHQSLNVAREFAERVFQLAGDLYSEVEIVRAGRHVETLRNPACERQS